MLDPKHIRIADYQYPLPDERIAKYPKAVRDESKLLLYRHGEIAEDVFHHLPQYIPAGELMVFNNTKVIQARLHFHKSTGALIEVFCLEPHTPLDYQQNFATTRQVAWTCLVGNLKKWKEGKLEREICVGGKTLKLTAERKGLSGTGHEVVFCWDDEDVTFSEVLEAIGEMPLPHYITQELKDKERYQTVYNREEGSAAAPTAGLHFTKEQMQELREMGVNLGFVTLHVGLGTFRPVNVENIKQHEMHKEFYRISEETAKLVMDTKRAGHRVIAVGTTSIRTLESAALAPGKIEGRSGWTEIFIYPGYDFKIVDALITNFHLPKSTLIMLISAFGGRKFILDAYRTAVKENYRFFSFGDAMFLSGHQPQDERDREIAELEASHQTEES